jgi:hypothetical protein
MSNVKQVLMAPIYFAMTTTVVAYKHGAPFVAKQPSLKNSNKAHLTLFLIK